MQVWRLQTNTDGGDMADYCIKNHVAAMGWPLEGDALEALRSNPSIDTFCELTAHYKGVKSVWRMAKEAAPNDIIWMKSKGQYYFARISEKSEWKYDFSEEAKKYDITNQLTNIYWYGANESGDEASVPGCLTTSFIRGSTFQRINKSGLSEYSQMLYNSEAGELEGYRYTDPNLSLNEECFWNLLQPDDAEDLLCMWLYKKYKYIVVPSTNKRGTELYECVLIDPESAEQKHIYIQVKKGNVTIDASEFNKLKGDVFFLVTGENGKVINADKPNYTVVPSKWIFDFAVDPSNRSLIPEGIVSWIRFLADSENENMDKSSVKGIMIDTNLSYSDTNEMEMLSQSRVCAYGDADRYIKSFNKGDYALFYSKGRGIIAIGEVISNEPGEVETEKGLYHAVRMIVPANGDYSSVHDKCISAREIKEILNRGFYFASTMKTPFLNPGQVKLLTEALEKKYIS